MVNVVMSTMWDQGVPMVSDLQNVLPRTKPKIPVQILLAYYDMAVWALYINFVCYGGAYVANQFQNLIKQQPLTSFQQL